MTKEELVRQAVKCFPPKVTTVKEEKAFIEGFVRGAEWMQERMIEKAAEWFEKYLFDIGYPDDWCRDSLSLISGKDRFIKAMQDESKRLDQD